MRQRWTVYTNLTVQFSRKYGIWNLQGRRRFSPLGTSISSRIFVTGARFNSYFKLDSSALTLTLSSCWCRDIQRMFRSESTWFSTHKNSPAFRRPETICKSFEGKGISPISYNIRTQLQKRWGGILFLKSASFRTCINSWSFTRLSFFFQLGAISLGRPSRPSQRSLILVLIYFWTINQG